MTTPKIIVAVMVAIAGVAATLLVRHQEQSRLQERREALEKQDAELAQLSSENMRLSNAAIQVDQTSSNSPSQELQALRTRAETLRQSTNELARQQRPTRTLPSTNAAMAAAPKSEEYYAQMRKSAGTSPTDGRDVATAMLEFARANNGQFPTNLNLVAPYLSKEGASLTSLSNFEIVFHGSRDDLRNVPMGAVVLIRERQPWPMPDGRLGRVYGMSDGASQMIASDDNFQDWESKHLIHPPTPAQIRK